MCVCFPHSINLISIAFADQISLANGEKSPVLTKICIELKKKASIKYKFAKFEFNLMIFKRKQQQYQTFITEC